MRLFLTILALLAVVMAGAQTPTTAPKVDEKTKSIDKERQDRFKRMQQSETEGVKVRLKDIGRFRGVRANQLTGIGIVVGLQATGDTRRNPQAARAISNYYRTMGFDVDPATIEPRNIAIVLVTAELPPFATNGTPIDVTVSAAGDATSLRGGTLIRSELYAIGDNETVYAVAQGPVSIGGFAGQAGGNTAQVGFLTAGRVPAGALVERTITARLVENGKLYFELEHDDFATALRVEQAISKVFPQCDPTALNNRVIQISLPAGSTAVSTIAKLEEITVMSDSAAVVVINEKTGSVAIGGHVRIAPVAIAVGTISVRIEEEVSVSQPNPFGQGTTQVVANQRVEADQSDTNIAVLAPNTTVADLARIFQELRLKATDIINILQLLHKQGALKARLVIQ